MGYNTKYEIETTLQSPKDDLLHFTLGESQPNFVVWLKDHSPDLDGYNPFEEPCKWYDHERDMKLLSETFPAYSFVLRGQGEDTSRDGRDIWVKRFFRGRMHVARAKVTFEQPPTSFYLLRPR